MIRFKKLSIKNFLSYGESPTVFNLDSIGTTLIVGEDLDNTSSGTGANGVGKTVWINALIYGLYGKPISNISLDKLVNNVNNKNMEVVVEFEKDNKTVTVKRCRKETGKGNYAMVFSRPIGTELNEDIHDETPSSIGDINEFIATLLGIPYELFVRIVAFAATHTPFLDLPVRHASQANQSDIMEELFRLTQLSYKAEAIKACMKDTKQSLQIKINHNEQLESEHERHNKLIDGASERVDDWETDHKENIELNKKLLKESEVIDVAGEEKLHEELSKIIKDLEVEESKQRDIEMRILEAGSLLKEKAKEFKILSGQKTTAITHVEDYDVEQADAIVKLSETIKGIKKVDISAQLQLHENLQENKNLVSSVKEDDQSAVDDVEELIQLKDENEEELSHLRDAKCPYCLQDFKDAETKVATCLNNITKADVKINELSETITVANKKLEALGVQQEQISSEITHDYDTLIDMKDNLKENIRVLKDLKAAENPYTVQLKELEKIDFEQAEKDIVETENNIELIATDLDKKDVVVNELKSKKDTISDKISIKDITKLYEIKNKISQYKTKIKELKGTTNPYLAPLKELVEIELEPIDMDGVNELNNLITHQNYMVKLLTKKDSFVRKALLTKNLTFLNNRLQHYLSALGLPHKVEFTHEMTANITQFGRELDFGNLSSGQKARVNLGLSFSFRDVLQKSHDSINVCMLDEVLDVGLDTVGVQNAARMLKRKARDEDLALYIISHRDEVSNIFDKKMVVQMEGGFSTIREED